MTPRTFFLYARVAVVAAVCGLLASARYSLLNVFPDGFSPVPDFPEIDRSVVLLTLGWAALAVAFVEFCRFVFDWRKRAARKNQAGVFARERIRPKFGI